MLLPEQRSQLGIEQLTQVVPVVSNSKPALQAAQVASPEQAKQLGTRQAAMQVPKALSWRAPWHWLQ
jgi:hypothetical protein